jgi:ABC-type transport system involved in multi-copper enzyme maturation permease subunit
LRSHEPRPPAPPVLRKEVRELATGNSLWVLMLLLSPLVGYGFIQAVALYAEASRPALSIPELARQLSPFDGILVPTLGGFYLAITLLFPFIAIRLIAAEKASGGLKLLVQLPYRLTDVVAAKFAALIAAWLIALIPVVSALVCWGLLDGHLDPRETATLMLGHLLYGLLIGAISFLAAALTEGGATAAILALAVTLGSWVLDFAALDRGGVSNLLAALSLTSLLRPFEQGLLSIPAVLGMVIATAGFLALAVIWLPPGGSTQAQIQRLGTRSRRGRDPDQRCRRGKDGSRRHPGSTQLVFAGGREAARAAPRAFARDGSPGPLGSPARRPRSKGPRPAQTSDAAGQHPDRRARSGQPVRCRR